MPKPIQITKALVSGYLKPLDPKAHKGTQGHALLVGGSYGKMGSICLSSKAALRSGCGLVTAFVPKCGYSIVQTYLPEAMVITDLHKNYISKIAYDIAPQAIGIGPGLGQEKETQKALQRFLKAKNPPLVIDADALNILAQNKIWYSLIPQQTLITPHPKELGRLIGSWATEAEQIEKVQAFATKHRLIVVCKGAPTKIITEDTVYENTTGNAALATAGSGDVLSGIVTALLAQGYVPEKAAVIGVYLHGLTADLAMSEIAPESFIASDIISWLGRAFLNLQPQQP